MDESTATLFATIVVIAFLFSLFFCISLYGLMKRIPREYHQFPIWFIWLILIPMVGFVFECIMLPFGVPNAIKKAYENDQDAIGYANLLFQFGLAQVIFGFVSFVFRVRPINDVMAGISVILWIVYWVLIVRFKRRYLVA